MNFNSIRTVITWVITIILIVIYIEIKKKKKRLPKHFNIIYVSISIAILVLTTFLMTTPFENLWKKFDNIESAFNYQYPDGEIIDIYESKEYSVIIWENNEQLNIAEFKKDNNFYKLTNPIFKTKTTPIDIKCMLKKQEISTNEVAIIITCTKNNEEIIITDKEGISLNTKILNRKEYYGIFNKEDYIIYNNKKIYLDDF